MKGIDNGWKDTPTVRYCLHDMEDGNKIDQPATQFPPTNTKYKKYYHTRLLSLRERRAQGFILSANN